MSEATEVDLRVKIPERFREGFQKGAERQFHARLHAASHREGTGQFLRFRSGRRPMRL